MSAARRVGLVIADLARLAIAKTLARSSHDLVLNDLPPDRETVCGLQSTVEGAREEAGARVLSVPGSVTDRTAGAGANVPYPNWAACTQRLQCVLCRARRV